MRTRWVVILALLAGLTFGYEMEARHLDVVHAAADPVERFKIFYMQHVEGRNPDAHSWDGYAVTVWHDELTGQETVCIRVEGNGASPTCYLTGRRW
jgi:hypothetical protein